MMNARKARLARQRRHGLAMIAATAVAFVAMVYGAATVDAARDITAAQSLEQWGL